MLTVWATNKSLFAKLSHSCPPLEISRYLISATGVYWIAILIAYAALTEYFFTWGWRKVRRQKADQSVIWSSSDHDRHPSWSSSVTRRFALDLRKPHRKKKTGCNYYCICASQLQPSKHNHDGRFNQLCYFEITWRSLMHLACESLTIQLASSYSKINDRFRFSGGLETRHHWCVWKLTLLLHFPPRVN